MRTEGVGSYASRAGNSQMGSGPGPCSQGCVMPLIATVFPALCTLALSDLHPASSHHWVKLQPLSQLTGLRDLRLSTQHFFADATLDSISSIRQQLERLELQLLYGSSAKTAVTSAPAVLRRLSSLGSLQHLTHLLFTCTLKAADGPSASLPLHGLGDAAAIAGLTACKRLISLQLPWAKLTGGAAELLAAGLPCLMQLTVRQVQPMAPVAPCSWRELTLLGELQGLHDLIKLPLSGLEHQSPHPSCACPLP